MAEILDTVMPDRIIGVVARPGCEGELDVFGYFASRSLDMESQGNRSFTGRLINLNNCQATKNVLRE